MFELCGKVKHFGLKSRMFCKDTISWICNFYVSYLSPCIKYSRNFIDPRYYFPTYRTIYTENGTCTHVIPSMFYTDLSYLGNVL